MHLRAHITNFTVLSSPATSLSSSSHAEDNCVRFFANFLTAASFMPSSAHAVSDTMYIPRTTSHRVFRGSNTAGSGCAMRPDSLVLRTSTHSLLKLFVVLLVKEPRDQEAATIVPSVQLRAVESIILPLRTGTWVRSTLDDRLSYHRWMGRQDVILELRKSIVAPWAQPT